MLLSQLFKVCNSDDQETIRNLFTFYGDANVVSIIRSLQAHCKVLFESCVSLKQENNRLQAQYTELKENFDKAVHLLNHSRIDFNIPSYGTHLQEAALLIEREANQALQNENESLRQQIKKLKV